MERSSFAIEGTTYPLNVTALSKGNSGIDPIWKTEADLRATRPINVDLSPLIDLARQVSEPNHSPGQLLSSPVTELVDHAMPCLQKRLPNRSLLPPLWPVLLRHQIENDSQHWPSGRHSGLACPDLVDEEIVGATPNFLYWLG